jgi:hypothetical protein
VQAATFSDIFLFRLLRKEKLKTALLFLWMSYETYVCYLDYVK